MATRSARPAARIPLTSSAVEMLPTAIVGTPASLRTWSANGVWNIRPHTGRCAHPGRRRELAADARHVVARHRARDLVARRVRDGRRRDDRPVPLRQRLVDPIPHEAGRALAAGVADLEADPGARAAVDELH